MRHTCTHIVFSCPSHSLRLSRLLPLSLVSLLPSILTRCHFPTVPPSVSSTLQGIIAAVLGLGTLNRVLYRLALVPLRDYVFFLAQAQNVGYLVIYYALMWLRFRWDFDCNGPWG